jgi:hypothetical protein
MPAPPARRRLSKLVDHTSGYVAAESFPFDPVAAAAEPSPSGYVELSGSPLERGKTHGAELGDQIHSVFDAWRSRMYAIFGGGDSSDAAAAAAWCQGWCEEFVSVTDYESDIEQWAPGMLTEVRGMAEATGISYSEMLTFQLMDEYWYHGKGIAEAWEEGSPAPEHCTAFALASHDESDAPAIVAQTMDLESFRDGYQTVLRVAPEGGLPEQLVFSHAGMVGLCGVNAAGVAISCNNLSQLNHGTTGLPVAFVVRAILQRSTFDDALSALLEMTHASGQNYTICGGDGRIAMVEGSENGASLYFRSDESPEQGAAAAAATRAKNSRDGFECHTNHPLASSDLSDAFLAATAGTEPADDALGHWGANTNCRYESIQTFLAENSAPARAKGREAVIALSKVALQLRTHPEHPVCRHPNTGSMSLGSCVFVSGETPALYCAQGPADTRPYREYTFSDIDGFTS